MQQAVRNYKSLEISSKTIRREKTMIKILPNIHFIIKKTIMIFFRI